jgi:hypothetical protein
MRRNKKNTKLNFDALKMARALGARFAANQSDCISHNSETCGPAIRGAQIACMPGRNKLGIRRSRHNLRATGSYTNVQLSHQVDPRRIMPA